MIEETRFKSAFIRGQFPPAGLIPHTKHDVSATQTNLTKPVGYIAHFQRTESLQEIVRRKAHDAPY